LQKSHIREAIRIKFSGAEEEHILVINEAKPELEKRSTLAAAILNVQRLLKLFS
jgi:hypothetical protein